MLAINVLIVACNRQFINGSADGTSIDSIEISSVILETDLGFAIDSLLIKEVEVGFSGSVIVVKDGRVILQNGYGYTDSSKTYKITPGTKFYLASTTKGVTGTVSLLLEKQNDFSMGDSIKKFFPNAPLEFSNITIHDMLIHQSGLISEYETYGYTGLEENVALIFSHPPAENPSFNYTGAGYWMTAAVIEKVTQLPYEHYVHEVLLKPAKMNNTSFWFEIDESNNEEVAQKTSEFPPNGIAPNWGFRASSGVLTNISDFYKYFKTISDGIILDTKTIEKLIGPHFYLKSGIGIGYGWYTSTTNRGTTEIWSRGGEAFGHNSALRWFRDEGVAILILTNCGALQGDREANRTVSDKIEKLIFKNAPNKR